MSQVAGTIEYSKVPLSIDLFISHPWFSKALVSRAFPLILILLLLAVSYYLIRYRGKRALLPTALVCLAVSTCTLGLYLYVSPLARIARNPTSSTIIAAIVYDKEIRNYLFFKQYYFIVDIDGEKHGVLTNKKIYSMKMYTKNATFDYSLYTYVQDDRILMYRFCRPENKVKSEQGNLQ